VGEGRGTKLGKFLEKGWRLHLSLADGGGPRPASGT
jgi:hypothetical protein